MAALWRTGNGSETFFKLVNSKMNECAGQKVIAIVVACGAFLLMVLMAAIMTWPCDAQCVTAPRDAVYTRLHLSRLHAGQVGGETDAVPKIIWQTWHELSMPRGMDKTVRQLKEAHPDFKHVLMDTDMCYEYIKARFPADVARAFVTLRPGAFKADLWRLCVLYMEGGIYLDVKYKVVPPFSLNALLQNTQFVRDRMILTSRGVRHGVYNALIVSKPGDARLLACIEHIVRNCKARYYGMSCLEPTGPALMCKHVDTRGDDMTMFYAQSKRVRTDKRYIMALSPDLVKRYGKNAVLLQCYKGYSKEQDRAQVLAHYSKLWLRRAIYDKDAADDQEDLATGGGV